jgi:drug/metabolite transporter (DMT)-like permease
MTATQQTEAAFGVLLGGGCVLGEAEMNDRQKGALLITISAGAFAFLPTITRSLYASAEAAGVVLRPTDIAFWRFFIAALVLGALVLLRLGSAARKPSLPPTRLAVLGGLYAFSAVSAFFGLQYINASLYVILFYTYPAMLALIYSVLGIPMSKWQWLALLMVLIGLMLTIPDFSFFNEAGNLLGVIVALANALSVAFYYFFASRWMRAVQDGMHHTAWTLLFTLLFISGLLPFNGLTVPTDPALVLLLAALATVCTVVPILAINLGLRYINAAQASIISSTEPVMAMLIAVTFLGEQVGLIQWLGAAFIIGAVLVLELSPRKRTAAAV